MATKAEQQVALLKQLEQHFERQDNVNSNALASELNWEHSAVVGILKSLEMMGKIETEAQLHVEYALTEEGEEILREGSPEVRLMNMLPKQVDSIKEDPVLARGMAQCLKNKWAVKKGDLLEVMSMPLGDPLQTALQGVKSGAVPTDAAGLQKRKMVVKSSVTYFVPRPTALFSTELAKQLVDLDRSILQTGEWRGAEFKPYNFNAAGIAPCFGSIHPLIKTMNMFRQILQQMNFEEMDTRRWVESSFWNFDALFQPQTHPVRDAHDTFFLKHPARSMDVAEQVALHEQLVSEGKALDGPRALDNISEATHLMDQTYFERVKEIHESGDHESHGWQFPWDAEESYKLILRTHTTAVTSRILRHLAMEYQKNPDVKIDRRFFSIDRVFRNETLDATHLAEFHQIEGIVASTTASLSELMGIIKTFFAKIGINDVEFKPAYNPYTEPSMEIFGFHPTLNKWTEIGNSGVFRPEMLRPMGLPEDLVVLGWGLSLERPTMINYNVKDIRELIGPKAKLSVF
ncbi:phenylalanyl-tRNA synthetase alpha subunit [Gregarina niphandrodes]|uniref:phenylalanine--tRNA ligase n=1 Tax=Gregarina niphandrodes TaxID=110365 RepID=A0A023B7K5_GRENI|nr:phenylalanyl-tRNA synthetase alpha subunit [Gregarina niphandrodes]EZG67417.1 phenylalanyl-tRNA synthetase alpha subunit [Gregarina niphandrodes]|eukprot:XP_011130250.1 phenylalanyl-tRNA synthetase alpha subunit [Gregarina niphandrodes]